MNEKAKKSGFSYDIPSDEIRFAFSRSSGPGGQNVNKVNTRVTLSFNLPESSRFTEDEKSKIRRALKRYLDKNGWVQVHSQRYRSQAANRNAAMNRLQALLQKALEPKKVRKKTKIPRSAVEKRLRKKKHQSEIKKNRAQPKHPDGSS